MKKAQALGLLGIAFIILIITIGLLFFLVQSLKNKQQSIQQSYQQSQLASNTIYALMKTTVKCDNLMCRGDKIRMDELVKSCVKLGNCDLVKVKLKEYLDFTFLDKGINYLFKVRYTGRDYIQLQQGDCREKKTEYFFIPLENKNIELSLEVCY